MTTILIVLFALSLAVVSSMLVLRMREIATESPNILSRMFPDDGGTFEKKVRETLDRALLAIQDAILAVLSSVLRGILRFGFLLMERIKKGNESIRNGFRKSGRLTQNGSASFYLKNIAEYTSGIKKEGEHEEE